MNLEHALCRAVAPRAVGTLPVLRPGACVPGPCGEHPPTVVTDHEPLTYLPTTLLSRRPAQWVEHMSRFHIAWVYEPGLVNVQKLLQPEIVGC